jgi:glycosyltransferase involved in cell wall biosynthesis
MVPTVSYVIVNNLGGITSLIINLIKYRGQDKFAQDLILLDIAGNPNTPANIEPIEGLSVRNFSIHPRHNWYTVYKQMAAVLGQTNGVLVSNDMYDLIMLTYYNIPKKVVQIVHDAYNVKLAIQFEAVVDAFICHSYFYYETLCQLLHHRQKDIYYLPYGIPLSGQQRRSRLHNNHLKLLFLGRHDKNKGVFDLFEINTRLEEKGIQVSWLILGRGPETSALKEQWSGRENVQFLTPPTNEEVRALASGCDIFTFPTRFEGFPVALVETMSEGCVPLASDLPGGIRELVTDNDTGFKVPPGDVDSFVLYIERLNSDRQLLEQLSRNSYNKIHAGYNALYQSPQYQELFIKVAEQEGSPRHHKERRKLGSRLDQRLLPNFIVKMLRKSF